MTDFYFRKVAQGYVAVANGGGGGVSTDEHTHLGMLTCPKLRKAMLLLLGLLVLVKLIGVNKGRCVTLEYSLPDDLGSSYADVTLH